MHVDGDNSGRVLELRGWSATAAAAMQRQRNWTGRNGGGGNVRVIWCQRIAVDTAAGDGLEKKKKAPTVVQQMLLAEIWINGNGWL